MAFLLKVFYRPMVRRTCAQILTGRMIERNQPERGRFLRYDVNQILKETWREVDEILPDAELDRLPTLGNRQNVFFAVLTVAFYHALIGTGVEKQYAVELFADVGWKLYTKLLTFPRLVARLFFRDPHKQMGVTLRMLGIYPFSAPGKPGYEIKAWLEPGRYCIDYLHCPPYSFVRKYVEKNGDRGELELFRGSWCLYDWAFAYAIAEGRHKKLGHYERLHTLSSGDDVCDMRWYGEPPQGNHTEGP
jgi:hypothetical protein